MRLVNADALVSELEKYSDPTARFRNEYLFGMQRRLETCIKLVKDAPTVDAVPCDVCRFAPPSSGDGKPCTICPAEGKDGEQNG